MAESKPEHRFADGEWETVLAADAERHGIITCKPVNDATDLIRSPYFALNVYRVMGDGKLYTIAREEPFAAAAEDGRLTLSWQPTATLPLIMEAVYRVTDPAVVDLELTVEATAPIADCQISISSYFDFSLHPYGIIRKETADGDVRPYLLKMEDHPFINGHYVILPRSPRDAKIRMDGRWMKDDGRPIARFVTGPEYGLPCAVMADARRHIVQMADPAACSCVNLTYSSDNPQDNIRNHNALYFDLFGCSFAKGEQKTARLRQVAAEGPLTTETVERLYREFIGG